MKNVEDVYPLSPMQEFMLLHSAFRPDGDTLAQQFCYEIEGDLDTDAFRRAWQRLLDRHAVLRSAFVWQKVRTPVQVVRRSLELPFRVVDWSTHAAGEQEALLAALRRDDLAQPFDLGRAPLMRLTLARLAPTRHVLLWSSHHLLMDRWCLGTLLEELDTCYGAAAAGREPALPPARPFRDYVAWLAAQDPAAAETYWRGRLRGFATPTYACRPGSVAGPQQACSASVEIGGADRARLGEQARAQGVTLGALVQAAWALALNGMTGSQDVLYAAAVSGRPPGLAGVESIVGCFINNLPVRVRLCADATPLDVARAVQSEQRAQIGLEHVSPASLATWSDCDSALYDHLLVWLAPVRQRAASGLRMRFLPGRLATAHPLTLSVSETPTRLQVQADVAPGHRTRVPTEELVDNLGETLTALAGDAARTPLGRLPGFQGTLTARELSPSELAVAEPALATNGPPPTCPSSAARAAEESAQVEGMLHGLWQQVLGHDRFDARQSFFEVGGNSLLAASLHARVEAGLRRSIPLLPLFRSPSLAGMVRTLVEADWPLTTDYVTALRKSGARPPLFGIASPEVSTLGFALLTRHLPAEQPVYLVQAPPDSERARRLSPREIPALCRRYLAEMRRVSRGGPVQLLGMCTGAQMTLEIARLLERDREPPAFVGIIDTWAYYTVSRLRGVERVANRVRHYRRRVGDLLRLSPAERLAELRRVSARRRARVVPGTAAAEPATTPTDTVEDDDERVSREWLVDFGLPGNDPGLPKLAAPVVVFRLRPQPYWRVRDRTLGWARQAREVRVEYLPGTNHHAILREPQVREFARRLSAHLHVEPRREESAA